MKLVIPLTPQGPGSIEHRAVSPRWAPAWCGSTEQSAWHACRRARFGFRSTRAGGGSVPGPLRTRGRCCPAGFPVRLDGQGVGQVPPSSPWGFEPVLPCGSYAFLPDPSRTHRPCWLELNSDRAMRFYPSWSRSTSQVAAPKSHGLQLMRTDHPSEPGDGGGSENPGVRL